MKQFSSINYQKGLNDHNKDESQYRKSLDQFDYFLKIQIEKLHNHIESNDWARVSRTASALKDFSK